MFWCKKMTKMLLKTPITDDDILKLKLKDIVYISGVLFTARDNAPKQALKYYEEGMELPLKLEGLPLFHCGPLVKK